MIDSSFAVLLPIRRSLALDGSYLVGSKEYQGKKTSVELRKRTNPQVLKMLNNMAEVYRSAVARIEEEKPNISRAKAQNNIEKEVDKVEDKQKTWTPTTSETHESRDVTIRVPMHGGNREGYAMNISFNLVNV